MADYLMLNIHIGEDFEPLALLTCFFCAYASKVSESLQVCEGASFIQSVSKDLLCSVECPSEVLDTIIFPHFLPYYTENISHLPIALLLIVIVQYPC
jgi:hypothetical protein